MAIASYHIALGAFAAETHAKLETYLAEIGATAGEHSFIWGGVGPRVEARKGWLSSNAPQWEFATRVVAAPEYDPTADLCNVDRAGVARWVVNSILGREPGDLGHAVEFLWQHALNKVGRGNAPEMHLTLCASLCNPYESGLLLGWLRGLNQLALQGVRVPRVHVVVGIGAATAEGLSEGLKRAMAARALLDIEQHAASLSRKDAAIPVYVVGEEPFDGGALLSDRPTQAALAAFALLGVAKDICRDQAAKQMGSLPSGLFSLDNEQRAWGGVPIAQLGGPFAAVGGFAATTPKRRLSRVLAARCALEIHRKLATQQPFPDLKEARIAALSGERQRDFLVELQGIAANAYLSELSRITSIGVVNHKATTWPRCDDVEQFVGRITDDPVWQRLEETFGPERFEKLPLDDWECSFVELELLVEQGMRSRRKRFLEQLQREVPSAVLVGLETAWSRIFLRASVDPELNFEPHRMASALLGECAWNLQVAADAYRMDQEQVRRDPAEVEAEQRRRLDKVRSRILSDSREIPSPHAVWMRLPLYTAAGMGLFLAFGNTLDVDPATSCCIGVAIGLGTIFAIIAKVKSAKRALLERIRGWWGQYTLTLDSVDEVLRKQAILAATEAALSTVRAVHERPQPAEQDRNEPRPLHRLVGKDFPSLIAEQMEGFKSVDSRLVAAFQSSLVEACLPSIHPADDEVLSRELKKLIGEQPAAANGAGLCCMLNALGDKHVPTTATSAICFPYARISRDSKPDKAIWKEDWTGRLPDDLPPEPSEAERISADYLETLAEYILDRTSASGLALRLKEAFGDKPVTNHPLMERARTRFQCSVALGDCDLPQPRIRVISSGAGDLIVLNLPSGESADFAEGAGRLTLVQQVYLGVSANSMIFVPNRDCPYNLMGKAWLHHSGSAQQRPMLDALPLE